MRKSLAVVLALLSAFLALPILAQSPRSSPSNVDCFIVGTCLSTPGLTVVYRGLEEPILSVNTPMGSTIYRGLEEPITVLNSPPLYRRPAPNSYSITRSPDLVTEHGSNPSTGSIWENRYQKNRIDGVDSRGNYWYYNMSTGFYWNADGRVCTGKGAARSCTK